MSLVAVESLYSPKPAVVQIAASGEWFQVGDQPAVSLRRRRTLQRLLRTLVEKCETGEVLTVTEAFQVGWPGERAFEKAAAMRVYTAMCTLRREGLKSLLVRHHDGYVLLGPFAVAEITALAS